MAQSKFLIESLGRWRTLSAAAQWRGLAQSVVRRSVGTGSAATDHSSDKDEPESTRNVSDGSVDGDVTQGRTYGSVQDDAHEVAEKSVDTWTKQEDDEVETLAGTGFDMSKRSRPAGDE